jgi:prepilin-type processing-associated H-X9-DG protein
MKVAGIFRPELDNPHSDAVKKWRIVPRQLRSGLSVWGLLALLVGIFLIVIVLLPAPRSNGRKAHRVVCTTHLKQIALAMLLWSEEHKTNFPMQVSSTSGGSKELTALGWVAPTFWVISNELYRPQMAICPGDKQRLPPAKSFSSLTDRKISYFLNRDVTFEKQEAVLLGDRHVATNGVGLPGGIAQIQDVQTVSWTMAIHNGAGNVALVDGSVHQTTSKSLRDSLKTTIVTNTLVSP